MIVLYPLFSKEAVRLGSFSLESKKVNILRASLY